MKYLKTGLQLVSIGLVPFINTAICADGITYETTTFEGEEITIPINVRYIETAPEVFEKARTQVREILIKNKNFGEKFGWGNDRIDKLLIGGFVRSKFSSTLKADEEFDYKNLRTEISFCNLPPHPHYGWWIADKAKCLEFFNFFNDVYTFTDECVVRKPRTDELAIIWRMIGWDITEPILVIEENNLRLVIDLDPDYKNIEWIEDISDVKFLISINEKLVEVKPAIIGDPKYGNIHYMGSDGETFYVIE